MAEHRDLKRPACLRGLAIAIAGCIAALACLAHAEPVDELVSEGRTLYRTGMRGDGSPLQGTTQGDVPLAPASAACAGCHRRSGLGGAEGAFRSPPVTSTTLFEPRQGPVPRPAYDARTLVRAVAAGIAPDGRELHPLMPRYVLADRDAAALTAYLGTLGVGPAPGLTSTDIELATVVTDDAPEAGAVVEVLQRFVEIKNAGTRDEGRRAAAAARHPYGDRHYRAYRRWNLSVWRLRGASSTWAAQLERHYRAREPFAVVSGATGHDWEIVHRFCEARELPCVLPVIDVPAASADEDHYSLYYSDGVRVEARVTARHAAREVVDPSARVLLVYRDDERGRAARDAFRAAWPGREPAEERVANGRTLAHRHWRAILERERPDVLVAWLPVEELRPLSALTGYPSLPRRVYTAESFTHWLGATGAPPVQERLRHVYPYALPADGRNPFPREQGWLATQQLDRLDPVVAGKALFACHAVGEALAGMQNNFSRDYLLEELEHMLDGSAMTSLYPRTTLGPGRRFLANGAYVAGVGSAGTVRTFTEPVWLDS